MLQDSEYRDRRKRIVEDGAKYTTGQIIPRVEYSAKETQTWGIVYNKIREMTSKYAVKQVRGARQDVELYCSAHVIIAHGSLCPLLQYMYTMKAMEENCGYSESNIPQLQDISEFLYSCTGRRGLELLWLGWCMFVAVRHNR